jgi:hypothetical protein
MQLEKQKNGQARIARNLSELQWRLAIGMLAKANNPYNMFNHGF